ncbi:glycosyltransferase family A protein [Solwaraspora sp. WMMD406]|uniref:glycosyltransferase family A protein n=1 Tax=Solwaraspora sp. WMMD406 TaxID=3016095 RepID=UPI002415DA62|nr:glycosyltransferase family A protein [Solwaraspora sp. WMMD406]MDG4766916.1 glycosyltransferase family A protein [Solwaraspora sp. WMMD406]
MNPFVSKAAVPPYHRLWAELNRRQPPQTATESPLLALGRSSDVDPLLPEQVDDARRVLSTRADLVDGGADTLRTEVLAGQRRVVERFLAGRRARFGPGQSQPLDDVAALAREGRDIFLVIKFMDEAPHLAATLHSLTNQTGVDLGRVVIVAVDNNSTDGSDAIVKTAIANNRSAARIVYLNQAMAGAGNAARFGVDSCIATVYEMCRADDRWERLQTATIAVSDGDTVYHPETLRAMDQIFAECPTVDGVMPFLTYKFTAALRLFHDYQPARPAELVDRVDGIVPTVVPVELATAAAHDALPRWQRRRVADGMQVTTADGAVLSVPLPATDEFGRRFGVLADARGRRAYLFEDRTLTVEQAPVSGLDAALVFLENGGVRRDEKWRWHTVVGHDIFLHWSFAGMGLPETMVFPDTSDALKTFRVWAFAIGGQHQLRRPGLRIATGSDYQSGRVLQAVGAAVRLGPAEVFAETETDRLIKMIRNFVNQQSVFYGETRSPALERATGLYVHMTRIQDAIEREMRDYEDRIFEQTAFPERVLFPLRWMLQNAVRFYAQGAEERRIVSERVWRLMFSPSTAARIEDEVLTDKVLREFADTPYAEKQVYAERVAEQIIGDHYPEIMDFYAATLRHFFAAYQVAPDCYEWLLDGVRQSRNAVAEQPPPVDPTAVWAGSEFDIDVARGQVVGMRAPTSDGVPEQKGSIR